MVKRIKKYFTVAMVLCFMTSPQILFALDEDDIRNFTVPAPTVEQKTNAMKLWATYYFMPIYAFSTQETYPLLSRSGEALGPRLGHRQWCQAALQGSVAIRAQDKSVKVYNVDGIADEMQVDCTPFYRYKKSGRIRFRLADGPYGDGARPETDYVLFPYRSVAVDPDKIPHGSVVFIPAARGVEVTLESGKHFVHDGYFFAADKGGAIDGNQIDVYEGVEKIKGFKKFVKSSKKKTFDAYLIKNEALRLHLDDAHLPGRGTLRAGEF